MARNAGRGGKLSAMIVVCGVVVATWVALVLILH
jgi:hypothetical protein